MAPYWADDVGNAVWRVSREAHPPTASNND